MSEVINPDNTETNETVNEQVNEQERAEKMKRMATAVKAVAGWFSYTLGMTATAFGAFSPLGTDMFSVIFGLVISIAGLVLLHLHMVQKNLKGKERIVKMVKYTGAILFIPGWTGMMVVNQHFAVYPFFNLFFLAGVIIFVISFILRKIWGLKPPKKVRKLNY